MRRRTGGFGGGFFLLTVTPHVFFHVLAVFTAVGFPVGAHLVGIFFTPNLGAAALGFEPDKPLGLIVLEVIGISLAPLPHAFELALLLAFGGPQGYAMAKIQTPNLVNEMAEVLGIYDLDGDNLKLCWNKSGDRPTEFVSKADSSTFLAATLKRLNQEGWSIVNVELPHFHLHEVTQTSAAVKELQGYQPNVVGALTYRGGGFRTAYL